MSDAGEDVVRVALEPGRLVRLALKAGSLEELLAGEYATRFWLHQADGDPEDVYRLSALVWPEGSSPSGEALLRVLSAGDADDGRPPVPEPTPEVAEMMERWQALIDGLPERDEG